MVDYAKHYLNISTEENSVIWWKLFNAPVSKEWSNILGLAELLFSLPMSNGHSERIFSQLKLIKTNRRTGLGEGRLDSLLCIVTTGPPLQSGMRVVLCSCGGQTRNVGMCLILDLNPVA